MKNIPGYPGYKIDQHGNVWSFRKKNPQKLRVRKGHGGYLQTHTSVCGKKTSPAIHRLLLLAFKGLPPSPKYVCRHLNGNPEDNRLENIEWGTELENTEDAMKHGTRKRKLAYSDVLKIKELIQGGHEQKALAEKYGVSEAAISKIKHGVKWKHLLQIKNMPAGTISGFAATGGRNERIRPGNRYGF